MLDEKFFQERTRIKYHKIRCPYCQATSKIISEFNKGYQIRKCKNNHIFEYDYGLQAIAQKEYNWKYKK